ncbi:GNAT family N-acetyltransferase [Yersinia enterocolitica]|uniref:GNAT family N-acetyltransferase n=3 Tax=Yersinia TaxID=629 RepID=A0ABM6URZ3_9GAMM|nr:MULTISPECIES: GNAT family N-acetyltransferase [Yersinia]HEC1652268.1 GNAT family N-acetyltransferase [Yersinia enterocolitica]ATM86368.1 N-acetyltransferase [Yersinia frederiksenii]AVX37698.1 GNAT family N-acetyltransferase [Yersinia massiliensis]MCB5317184.1 GNAT family N-acetyltransferase [Yersinia massiliensis]MDN0129207.1 GNAT family N-acetyltransferase [Yersinia massiliensis]
MKTKQSKILKSIYRPMRCDEFDLWADLSLNDYVEDLITNHRYSRKKAQVETSKSFKTALPAGINTPNNHFRTYEHDGQAAGYLWFSLEDNSAFLSDIILIPEFQGKGMGRDFIRAFLNELTSQGAYEVELRVSPDNQRALKLYKEFGFRITGFDMSLLLEPELSAIR